MHSSYIFRLSLLNILELIRNGNKLQFSFNEREVFSAEEYKRLYKLLLRPKIESVWVNDATLVD